MEIRKLQYSGKGTYVLSLPKKWLEKHELVKGDKFAVHEMENGLFITPTFIQESEKVAVIQVSEFISKEITARYTYGYNKIIIKGPISSHYRVKITNTLSELMGYDILEENDEKMIITDFLNPSQLNISKTLKREFFLASLMVRNSLEALQNMDLELARDVIKRDSEVNKLYFLTVRQIRTALQNTTLAESIGVNYLESIDLRVVSKCVEEIGDHASRISNSVLELGDCDDQLIKRVTSFGERAHANSTSAIDSFIKVDKRKSAMVLNEKKKFYIEKSKLDTIILQCNDAIRMRDILENIKGIGDKAFEIAQLAYKP